MDLDIVIYAIIAALVLARLWSLFGRRNEDEPQGHNPFVTPAPDNNAPAKTTDQHIRITSPSAMKPFQAPPNSLAGALEQAHALDPSFDEKQFLQGARTAFSSIVEDFARGDLSRIARMLGSGVLPHFEKAVNARRAAGQTMESKIIRFKDVEISSARMDDTRAFLTVRYITDQQNILRGADGQPVEGDHGGVEEITDMWVFSRDMKSSDPNWVLVETKS